MKIKELIIYGKNLLEKNNVENTVVQCDKDGFLNIEDLKNELSRLVAEEKYEQAAIVRDKIKELEGKGNE